jgi:general secretion pathway protein G
MTRPPAPIHGSRGFTLVELIVVIVILGVMTGLVVPRLASNDRRRAEAEVRSVAGMLTLIAQRDGLGNHQMAMTFQSLRSSIRLDTRRRMGATDRRGGVAAASVETGQWRPDPLLSEVVLDAAEHVETRFDGKPADDRNWRIEFAPGGSGVPRPVIEIVIAMRGNRREARPAWLVELLPSAPEASMVTADARTGAAVGRGPVSVDLDRLGRSDVPW